MKRSYIHLLNKSQRVKPENTARAAARLVQLFEVSGAELNLSPYKITVNEFFIKGFNCSSFRSRHREEEEEEAQQLLVAKSRSTAAVSAPKILFRGLGEKHARHASGWDGFMTPAAVTGIQDQSRWSEAADAARDVRTATGSSRCH